jgi:uncharacterized protein
VRAMLEMDCGRCLEPFDLPVVADVDLTYVPLPAAQQLSAPPQAHAHASGSGSGSGAGNGHAASTPVDLELQDEDLSTAYYEDQSLDLGEMVREQLNLALPMRPLCQDACKGLCPQCGTNRNHATCACDVKWEDPRLAGLRSLLTNKEHSA